MIQWMVDNIKNKKRKRTEKLENGKPHLQKLHFLVQQKVFTERI